MKKRTAVFLLALGAVWLSVALAWGQLTVPKLTDADVQRLIPVMKAQAAEMQAGLKEAEQQHEQMQTMFKEMEQCITDLEAGKLDPLAYLKQRSKYVTAPPSAVYKPKLSRLVSLNLYGIPTAIFSYGIESETARNLASGGEVTFEQFLKFGDIYKGPAGKKIKAAEEEFMSFYTSKGFTKLQGNITYPGYNCTSPDGSAWAEFVFFNTYTGAEYVAENVETIPSGPILEIHLSEFWSPGEKPQPMEKTESPVPTGKEQALRKAGMSEEKYGEYVGALGMARNDAADPSRIDTASIGLDYEGPMDPEMKKTLEEMKTFYEIRRQNSLVYKRHAAALDPLLTAMGY